MCQVEASESRQRRRCWPAVVIAILLPVVGTPKANGDHQRYSVVSREEILEAMRQSKGYDLKATTNAARLHAEVILRLARQRHALDRNGPPLTVGHAEWFQAFLDATGLTTDRAPVSQRLAYQYRQDMEIDYRAAHVIQTVIEGPRPEFAVNVQAGWTERTGGPEDYSYEDRGSVPSLKVTNKRLVTYRLVDYGDMVVFDQIEGLMGRPTSGLLAFLFRVVGEGRIVEYRMAISSEGVQVSRGRARKAFLEVVTTTTIYPGGRAEKDVPAHRADLRALEARLKRPIRVRYQPLIRSSFGGTPR
jgi:hypothetical protein